MNDLAIQPPEDLAQEAPAVLLWSRNLAISSPETHAEAADGLRRIKGAIKRAIEFFRPMKARADETKKAILDAEKQLLAPLQVAEDTVKTRMLAWSVAEEQKRLAEQLRLQAEADEKARREREALERKAVAAKKPETKERYQEQAAQVVAPVVHVPAPAPIAGISSRTTWKACVVDAAQVPRQFLVVDDKTLQAYARAMREQAKVPGVEFYKEEVLAARSK